MRNIDELQELILQSYSNSLDLDIAFLKHGVTDEEKEALEQDEVFSHRLALIDADFHEEIVKDLRELKDMTDSDSVKLNAIRDLGQLFYPKRFKEINTVPVNLQGGVIVLPSKETDGD